MSTLSDRLRDATRDIVTGERLLPGLFGHSPIEDLEAAADELDRLTARVAELERDARRIDWIERSWIDGVHVEVCGKGNGTTWYAAKPSSSVFVGPSKFEGDTLRSAIDTAMENKDGR